MNKNYQNNVDENYILTPLLTLLNFFGLKYPNFSDLDNRNEAFELNKSINQSLNYQNKNEEESYDADFVSSGLKLDTRLDIYNRSELQMLLEQNQFSVPKIPYFEAGEVVNEENTHSYSTFLESWNLFRRCIKENEILSKVSSFKNNQILKISSLFYSKAN